MNISKKQIFYLSIPVFFSNSAVPLIGIVDIGLMGNLGNSKYLAATSVGTAIMSMIIWSFAFLRMGTVGIVSQLYGKSDYREIVRTLIRNFIIAVAISIILILSKSIILNLTQNFFSVTFETQKLIETYISVRLLSIPAEFLIYILVGFYFGIQKTKISSLIVITLSILNIVFSSFFVLMLNLNIFGVALGTLIASYIVAIIFSYTSYNYVLKKFQIVPTFQRLFVLHRFTKLFIINFDIFLRTLFLTFSFLWIAYLGSKLGEDFLAVNSILMQFIVLAAFFLDAYAFSSEGVVGYTIGKKRIKSFLLVVSNSIQLSFFTALIISILYLIFFKQIINLITDVDILRFISYQHAIWVIIIPPIASFCYQLDGIFIGASQTKEIRNAMIIAVASFLILSIYLTKYFNNHGLWFSLMLFMALRALTLRLFFSRILRKF